MAALRMGPFTLTATPARAPLFTRASALLLALIVAGGGALRVHGLDAESAWLDEAFAIGIARAGLDEVLYETRLDVHPPLYYVLLTGWLVLFDGSVWSARLLSVVCSLGVLVAAYVAGARLLSRETGLVAAALLAVSVFQIEFAQEARMYALLTLLAAVATITFRRLFEPEPPLPAFLLYTAATTAMIYTHVYGLFVVAGQIAAAGVDLAWHRRAAVPAAFALLAACALAFAAFLWWLPVFTWQVDLVQTRFWIEAPEPTGFVASFRRYAGSPELLRLLGPIAVIGLVRLMYRSAPGLSRRPLFFVLPWLAAPIAFPFLLSLIDTPIFLSKYTIPASVPFAILVAAGLTALPWRRLRIAAVAALVVLSLRLLPAYYAVPAKDGWREAVATLEALAEPGDAVVLYPYFNRIAFDFYVSRDDLQVRPLALYTEPPPVDGWEPTIRRATGGRPRVWLVALAFDSSKAPVVEAFGRRYLLRTHQVRQKIEIFGFDRR